MQLKPFSKGRCYMAVSLFTVALLLLAPTCARIELVSPVPDALVLHDLMDWLCWSVACLQLVFLFNALFPLLIAWLFEAAVYDKSTPWPCMHALFCSVSVEMVCKPS